MQLKQVTQLIDFRQLKALMAARKSPVTSVLVLYAHPDPSSLCAGLCERVVRGLESSGKEVTVLDLYELHEQGFRTAMSCEERLGYEGPQPIIDPLVRVHADLLQTVDALVLVYPTWNMGLPAILKGWIERVLVPGVGFKLDEETNKVQGGLGHIKYFVGVSTYGSPRWLVALSADGGKRVVARCLRMMSPNPSTRTKWFGLFQVDSAKPQQVQRFLDSVEHSMVQL
jgi:NAD(P)H dehydrogenase (quinone)